MRNRVRDGHRTRKDVWFVRSKNLGRGLDSRNRTENALERKIGVSESMKSTTGGWPRNGTSVRRLGIGRGSEKERGKESENGTGIGWIGTEQGLDRGIVIDPWIGIIEVVHWIAAVTEEDVGQWIEVDGTVPEIDSEDVVVAGIVTVTTEMAAVDAMDEITVEVVANRKMTSTRIRSARA